MIKKLMTALCCLGVLFMLLSPAAFAEGDGNMDGGGGDMGDGTSQSFWNPGNDGCRVSIVDAESGALVSSPMDFTNKTFSNIYHFGKVSKAQYRGGQSLAPDSSTYTYYNPSHSLPQIISTSGRNNIETLKRYWCSEYAAEMVAQKAGMTLEELTNGSYKLIIEPLSYFKYKGTMYCMSATEAALYDQKAEGKLRYDMASLTHKNQPLSIFLERSDLGFNAWTGSKSKAASNSDIISYLGIGIVSYKEMPPEEGDLDAPDYLYRTDTDVISSIHLRAGSRITPDRPASVTFTIGGRRYTVNNIVIPAGSSQVVWVKWHTPSTPQRMTIHVSASGGTVGQTDFIADIVDMNENIPPDPTADDTSPGYRAPSLPSEPQRLSASWRVWYAYWVPNWEWCSHGKGKGHWVDRGDWEFDFDIYSASVSARMVTMPDDIVPTADGKNMKSGYGIKTDVSTVLSTDAPESHFTYAQTGLTYFPEFNYETYWRLLERVSGGRSAKFRFQENEFSTYNRAVHFTPIWFPDHTDYKLYGLVWDVWTPEGMLSVSVNDYVSIESNVFDDWYTNRG